MFVTVMINVFFSWIPNNLKEGMARYHLGAQIWILPFEESKQIYKDKH